MKRPYGRLMKKKHNYATENDKKTMLSPKSNKKLKQSKWLSFHVARIVLSRSWITGRQVLTAYAKQR